MKNLFPLILSIIVLAIFSCKKESYSSATIIRDCTGTYLRVLDKDYQVCNIEKTASFENEQKVLANFNLIKECKNEASVVSECFMLHANAGLINIIDVKKL
ncbi:MAG: hypothetical protein EOO96_24810 [Pedobacter sp.]|nr:MAG: hypothetical protein EOO96_24810 [Pedobacter sp.]